MNWIRIGNHVINLDNVTDIQLSMQPNHNLPWQQQHSDEDGNYVAAGYPLALCATFFFTSHNGADTLISANKLEFFGEQRAQIVAWLVDDLKPTDLDVLYEPEEAISAGFTDYGTDAAGFSHVNPL